MAATNTFLCSFCENPIRFQEDQLRRRGKCPNCQRAIMLLDNENGSIEPFLCSTWYYRKLRMLLGTQEIGPVDDTTFLQLVRENRIEDTTEVMSPELTKGEWIERRRVKVALIQQNVEQWMAERARRRRIEERRRQEDAENRGKLQRAIRSAVESGTITSGHRRAIERFAVEAGIPEVEVSECIARESTDLVRQVFDEALADGILEPSEERQISQLAVSLGVELSFSREEQRRIGLCRLAYALDSGTFVPATDQPTPFKLGPKEFLLSQAQVRWHEIVELKRPHGIPLGSGQYLKWIGEGEGYMTTKQVAMIGPLQSKKFLLSSVQRVTRFTDGILFNRSSGKSVFLELDVLSEAGGHFALLAEHGTSGEPVLGFDPTAEFIPEIVELDEVVPEARTLSPRREPREREPRYTFRVVGDHVGGRAALIQSLRQRDPLHLVREPENPYDANAVAVYDDAGRQLGYLKREVAVWFSPILTEKPVTAHVHRVTEYGSLIVAVYL